MSKTTIILFFLLSTFLSFGQEEQTYEIGDYTQGGIVFWLDETGKHGLVCAKSDQALKTQWDNELEFVGESMYPPERNTKSVAIVDGIYAGAQNTKDIIKFVGNSDKPFAALICDEFVLEEDSLVYDDWYLPSKEELNLMYLNRVIINETTQQKGGESLNGKTYWTSTDVDCSEKPYNNIDNVHLAWGHNFNLGSKKYQLASKKYMPYAVRAIRAF